MGIAIDLTISLGTLLETVIIGGGGVATVVTLRNTVKTMKSDFIESKKETREQFEKSQKETREQFDKTSQANKAELNGIQKEIEKIGTILVEQGRFDERLIAFDKRLTAQGRQIDDLRRGEGFIQGPRRQTVDGEYP